MKTAQIIDHPGFFATVYAEPIERQDTQATIIWSDYQQSTGVCVIWQDRPQPVRGQREIEIEGRTYRLRWLPGKSL